MDRQALQKALGLTAKKHFLLIYLRPALDAGLIEMTTPDKPHSSQQRYRLTQAGTEYLKKQEKKAHVGAHDAKGKRHRIAAGKNTPGGAPGKPRRR